MKSKYVKKRGGRRKRKMQKIDKHCVNLCPGLGASNPLPDQILTKLGFTSSGIFDGTVGTTTNYYNYTANSIYDPYAGTGGYSAAMFSQFMALYNSYRVYGCKVDLEIIPSSNSTASDVGIWWLGESNAVSNRLSSPQYAFQGAPELVKVRTVFSGTSQPRIRLVKYFDLRKIIGDEVMSSVPFTGGSASNPSNAQYFQIAAFPLDGLTAPGFRYRVNVTYNVRFEDPIVEQQVLEQ